MLQEDILISERESIKDALKKMTKSAEKVLLVIDNKKRLLGVITDGDIRRYILKGRSLDNGIGEVYNKTPHYLKKQDFSIGEAKRLLIENKIELLPILDEENKPVDFITWSVAFSEGKIDTVRRGKIDIPVVIMAGGKGSRLEPFTRILPKALIPIGDRSIIEIIIDEFKKQGALEYYVTLNAKGEMVKSYFDNIEKDYEINYVWEKNNFLGTAGSLKSLENKIGDVFIVSNCDVIVKVNFEKVVNFHKEQNASLTLLSAVQHYRVPYGVVRFKDGGDVTDIHEKPEYTFMVNAGAYVVNRESLRLIPDGSPFDMTDLIRSLIKNNKKVVMYPINENEYIDIGQWEEYKKAIGKLELFR